MASDSTSPKDTLIVASAEYKPTQLALEKMPKPLVGDSTLANLCWDLLLSCQRSGRFQMMMVAQGASWRLRCRTKERSRSIVDEASVIF